MALFPIDVVLDPGNAIAGGKRVEDTLNRISNASDRMRDQLNRGISQVNNGFGLLDTTAKRLAATVAGVFAGIKFTGLISETTKLYQNFSQASIVMQQVGRNAGYSAQEVEGFAEAVRKSGISMIESRNTITKLASSNVDLANATKLARIAQDAAVIGQINSSEALGRLIHGLTTAQIEVLRNIGIVVNFEQAYKKLAQSIGKNTDQLTEQEKAQARLNVVLEAGEGIAGSYEASLQNAGKMYGSTARLVEDLKVKVGQLFDQSAMFAVTAYTEVLKEANRVIDDMTESGQLEAWGNSIARTLAFLVDGFRSFIITVELVGKKLGAIAAKTTAFFQGDFASIRIIDEEFSKDLDAGIDSMSKMRDAVEKQIMARTMLTKATDRQTISTRNEVKATEKVTGSVSKQVSEQNKFIEALKREAEQAGLTSIEIRKLEAARLGATKEAQQYIKILEEREIMERRASESLDNYKRDMSDAMRITESVRTPLERYNEELENLNRLYNQGAGPLSAEAYRRKIIQIQDEFLNAENAVRRFSDTNNQFMIQAARNIQTAFADFLFDPFDKGLKGMVVGVANAVRRMLAEFGALKIIQASGIGSFLGLNANGTMASTGGGSNALTLANLGSNVASLFSSGLGATGLIGSGISSVGSFLGSGSMAAFGAGFGGDLIGGVAAGVEAGMTGSAAASATTMGSTFAGVAGPLIALAAVDMIGRFLAGNKSTGTFVDSVPVIGGFAAALFGRGPLKQRDTVLDLLLGSGGIEEGSLRTNFRAKGGLFRSNKNDFAEIDAVTGQILTDNKKLNEYAAGLSKAATQIIDNINATVTTVSNSLFEIGDNLGLSTSALEQFQTQIKLVSENGKFLTDEQIAEEIARVSDELVKSLLPAVEEFGKAGESTLQTIQRLNGEFSSLVNAAYVLSGSLFDARKSISDMTFEARTNIVESAGGLEAFTQMIGFFSSNFLSDQERLAMSQSLLRDELGKLGITTDLTRQEFTKLIKSVTQAGGISIDMALALLKIAPLFHEVASAMEANVTTGSELVGVESDINSMRQQLISSYRTERGELERVVTTFDTIATSLKNFRNDLALGDLSPLTPGQKLEEARTQFNRTRSLAAQGDEQALSNLPDVARNFLQASQTYNASSAAYISDFNLVMSVLESAERTALTERDIAKSQLSKLEQTVSELVDLNDNVITVDNSMKALTAAVLQGEGNDAVTNQQLIQLLSQSGGQLTPGLINNLVKSEVSAKQFSQATGTPLDAISRATEGLSVSDRQIREYVDANINNPMQIYNAAIQWGISSQRLSTASGIPLATIQQFVRDNNLASFKVGTDFVPRDGIAMLHRGEAVVPSGVARETQELRKELAELRRDINRQTEALVNVIIESNRENAEMISESAKDIETIKNWNEKSKASLK